MKKTFYILYNLCRMLPNHKIGTQLVDIMNNVSLSPLFKWQWFHFILEPWSYSHYFSQILSQEFPTNYLHCPTNYVIIWPIFSKANPMWKHKLLTLWKRRGGYAVLMIRLNPNESPKIKPSHSNIVSTLIFLLI